MPAPEGECERDQEQDCGEQAPRQLARTVVGDGLEAADIFFIFARSALAGGDFRRHGRRVAGSLQILGNGLVFIEAEAAGIGADKALVEDASRQLVELIFLQRLQHAGADLSGAGNLLQGDLALFAFLFQFFAKGRQPSLSLSLDGERNFTLSRSGIIGVWSFPANLSADIENAKRQENAERQGTDKFLRYSRIASG